MKVKILVFFLFIAAWTRGQEIVNYNANNTKGNLLSDNVRNIVEDNKGNLWFGTQNGIVKYNGKDFTPYTFKSEYPKVRFENFVLSSLKDYRGNLWFLTSTGIRKFDGKNWETIKLNDSLPIGCCCDKILLDSLGNIWMLSSCEAYKYDGKKWTKYLFCGAENFEGFGICSDGNPFLRYCEGQNSKIEKFDKARWNTFFESRPRGELIVDKNHKRWVIDRNEIFYKENGWKSFDELKKIADKQIQHCTIDKNGNVWVATDNGVFKFDGKEWINYNTTQGLKNNYVRAVFVSSKGVVWALENGVTKITTNKTK